MPQGTFSVSVLYIQILMFKLTSLTENKLS